MNSQEPSPTGNYNRGCQTSCSCTIFNSNVYNINWFRFYPQTIGTPDSIDGFYYVLDTTSVIKPMTMETYYDNNNCTNHIRCLTFPDINYIIINTMNSNNQVQIYAQFGNAISQVTTNMVAKVWNSQRYMGNHTINISPTCWNQLLGTMSSVTLRTTPNTGKDYYIGRRKAEFYTQFTVQYAVPVGGTISIVFPSKIPKIYPHCRSMTNLGSVLVAEGTT